MAKNFPLRTKDFLIRVENLPIRAKTFDQGQKLADYGVIEIAADSVS